jgi:elongation factor Ts
MQSEDLAGKNEEIKAKMVDGRLGKILKTKCLMEQPYIKDPSQTMEQVVKSTIATLGENIKVARFVRMELGA